VNTDADQAAHRRLPKSGTVAVSFGVVLADQRATSWPGACLAMLRRDFGAGLRFAAVLHDATEATQPGAPAASTLPRHLNWPARRSGAGIWQLEPDASVAQVMGEVDLLIVLGDFDLNFPARAMLPGDIWRLAFGTSRGLRPSVADIARDLLSHATAAEIHVLRPSRDGLGPMSVHCLTTRVWPWMPQRSLAHLRRLAPRCLRAALQHWAADPDRRRTGAAPPPMRSTGAGRRWPGLLLAVVSKAFLIHAWGWRGLFFREHWRLGIVDLPLADVLQGKATRPPRWLDGPGRFAYLADPFHAVIANQRFLLAERLDYWRSKGVIVAAALTDDGRPKAFVPLLETAGHVSYPFVATVGDHTWLCPESWESGRLESFALASRNGQLSVAGCAILLPDWPVVDPTLVQHDGTWWLFCGNQTDAPNENLFLWFADNPRGPWSPHPWNPVVSDLRHARPAGPLASLDGRLIRPAQNCQRTYGGAIALMQIDRLSRAEYRESLIRYLEPAPDGPCPAGLHTIGPLGERTVIDGKRWIFSPLNPLFKLLAWLKNGKRRAALRRT